MEITFDRVKRETTLRDRGLDFADAAKVFAGLHTVRQDTRFDYPEPRLVSAGWLEGRMVVPVWTETASGRRIISMRHCHAKEEKRWRTILCRP